MNERIFFLKNNLSNEVTEVLIESITKNTDHILELDNSFNELEIMIMIEDIPVKDKDNYFYKAFLILPTSESLDISFIFSFEPIANFKWLYFPIDTVKSLKKFNVNEIEELEFRDMLLTFSFKKSPSKKEIESINLFRLKIINNLSFYISEFKLENNIGVLHFDSQSSNFNTSYFYSELKKLVKKLNVSKIDVSF
jgi:hypothetical protein